MTGVLRTVLARYPASSRPTAEPVPLGNAGGFSGARIWRFPSPRGFMAIRAWPVDGPDRARLEQIHLILTGAADLGFLPIPIRSLDGQSIVEAEGKLWEVTPWIPGQPDITRPPNLKRRRSMFEGLAAFHVRVSSTQAQGPSPGLVSRLADIHSLLLGDFQEIEKAIDRSPRNSVATMTQQWLDRARPIAPGLLGSLVHASTRSVSLQTCLRDARADHFLFEGDKLTGLVDFGAMGRDTVAGDLARLMGESIGSDRSSRIEALDAYEAIRPLELTEIGLIEVFEQANALLGAGRWARWHFLEHRTFDEPEAVSRGLRRGLDRMDEQKGWMKLGR